MTFNVLPCSNATPHQQMQLRRQVDCHHTLISSDWTLLWLYRLTPSLYTITFFTMMLILSRSLKIQPFGRVIFLLVLQCSNITLKWRHQSLQSCRCSLLPPKPPQVTVFPAPLPPEPVELFFIASPGLNQHFIYFASTTWKKCKLAIVDEHALSVFQSNFPLTKYLFLICIWSLLWAWPSERELLKCWMWKEWQSHMEES
jgi:hypothetical protein